MTTEGTIMKTVPGFMALGVLGPNIKLATDSLNFKKGKKHSIKPFVNTAVGNFIGIGLIGPTAKLANAL